MEPNVKMDITQFNNNVEMYGFEAAVSWASQFPNTISLDLNCAFGWSDSKEGYDYWKEISGNRKQLGSNNQPTPKQSTTEPKVSSKPLPMEEEIQKRIDERKATNAKNKAIHEKAIELAEASRKKLKKKLKQLMIDEGVVSE